MTVPAGPRRHDGQTTRSDPGAPPAPQAGATRDGWPGWAAPVGTAAAAAAGCVVVGLVDPNVPGRYPVCPFLVATGLWCPVCGSLRALHALARGDVAAAAGANVLLLAVLPGLLLAWLVWASPRLGGPRLPRPRIRPVWAWSALAVLVAFGVARNLPAFAVLAP